MLFIFWSKMKEKTEVFIQVILLSLGMNEPCGRILKHTNENDVIGFGREPHIFSGSADTHTHDGSTQPGPHVQGQRIYPGQLPFLCYATK